MEYKIKVTIGPADLKFDLYFKGEKFSKRHDRIAVEWNKEGAAMKPKENNAVEVASLDLRGFV